LFAALCIRILLARNSNKYPFSQITCKFIFLSQQQVPV
jgi:hypothetical protein